MTQVSDLKRWECLVWETKMPSWGIDEESPSFWLLGRQWNLRMKSFASPYAGYSITLRKVTDNEQLKSGLFVTTYTIRGGAFRLYQKNRFQGAEETVWSSSIDSMRTELGSAFENQKFALIFLFHTDEPVISHPSKRETDLSKDKSVQASSVIPPDLEGLSRDFRRLLDSEIFPDVKVRCGDRSIGAHRSILAARSEVFASMFRNRMAESETGNVDVTDVDSDVLDLLLKYVYSGKIPDLCDDTASSLYATGDKYAIHALKKSCSDWMVRNLTNDNCLGFLILAEAHNDEEFKDRVVDFVAENLESIKREAWSEFSKDHAGLAVSVYERRFAPTLAKQS